MQTSLLHMHGTRTSRGVLYTAAVLNCLFLVYAFCVASPAKRTFENVFWIGIVQVGVSLVLVAAAIRIARKNRFDFAIALISFLACGHTLIPLGIWAAAEYKGTRALAIGQVLFASLWWVALAVILKNRSRNH